MVKIPKSIPAPPLPLTEEELITFFVVRGVHAAPVVGKDALLCGFVSLVDVHRRRGPGKSNNAGRDSSHLGD